MWDPVVSGAFWKRHPGRRVRSCSLLPGFKARAKPLVAAGWVISSGAGTGSIGRAPSPWGQRLHPRCLPRARRLLHTLTNWISRAVSPAPLGSTIFTWRGREPACGGLEVGCEWEERLQEAVWRPMWLRKDHPGPPYCPGPPPALVLPLPQDPDWKITEISIWNPGASLFLLVES